MIGTEKLELIIELALWSGCLQKERPLSLLIIAKPESGKSQLVLRYKVNNPGVIVISDCTAHGIQKTFLNEMKDKLIHHIIIPDLITPLSRQPATVATFIAFLNGLTEEGIVEVHTFAQDFKVDGLNVGLVSTITPSILNDSRHRWTRMGFLSRMLPVAYKYSQKTAQEVLNSITKREYKEYTPKQLNMPIERQEVNLPRKYAQAMLPLTERFSLSLKKAERLYGFRHQKQLQVLLQAHALMSGRDKVNSEDVDAVKSIIGFVGTKARKL